MAASMDRSKTYVAVGAGTEGVNGSYVFARVNESSGEDEYLKNGDGAFYIRDGKASTIYIKSNANNTTYYTADQGDITTAIWSVKAPALSPGPTITIQSGGEASTGNMLLMF